MKRTAILLSAFSLLVIRCKETKKEIPTESETTNKTVVPEDGSSSTQASDDAWVNDIMLNNGVKWQANKETTDGVTAMKALIDATDATNVADYKKLGDALNEVKNTVVRECTMKGASHDNLHVWLHPLIEKIEMLQNVKNTEEGAQLTSKIKTHLEGYYDYFI
ncbi:hypothetical protein RQM65_15260 [Pricia sp. S334]|uniref:Lipoprotein n=1 Tax=Pricia mediterranea TaxID=3076079 RepID=A0ABU3L8L0_9FLAO|nr:hypothetical protein [Pricia sp. S334]MDT7830025.1 hypothetical protein [Pricia sp. S334]